MKEWRQKHKTAFLVLGCYALCLVLALLVGLGRFVYNRVLYANGTLQPASLTLADFEWTGSIEAQENGTLLCLDTDPQLYLKDVERRVDTLRIDFAYSQDPQLVTAFWAAPDEEYSIRRMAYAREGGSLFWLPPGGGQTLRLDPGIAAGNVITSHSITINEKRPFYAFFIPSGSVGAALLAGPALLACGLSLLGQLPLPARRKKKEATP